MKIEAKLWLLEGEQGFNTIWPSDPVFFIRHDPYSKLDQDTVDLIILS